MNASPETRRITTPEALVDEARRLGRLFATGAADRDVNRRMPHAEIDQIRESGILAARLPAPYGANASIRDQTRIIVELARGDSNIAQSILPHVAFTEKLILFDNRADQERFFPLIASGALITNAIAERDGKFVGELKSRLVEDGDGYRLHGQKYYATGSLFAQYLYITGVRDNGSALQVVVPVDREGLEIRDDWDGFGQRLTASGTVVLTNVRIEPDEVFHGSENAGRRNYFGASSQLHHAALDTGMALAALDDAIVYSREKARPVPESGVEKASEDRYVIHSIGELASRVRAALAVTERAADVLDETVRDYHAGRSTDDQLAATSIAIAEAKAVAMETCLAAGEMLFRVGGASATLRPLGLDRHWRNARTHTLHDPIAYKYWAIGNYLLNGVKPPINAKY